MQLQANRGRVSAGSPTPARNSATLRQVSRSIQRIGGEPKLNCQRLFPTSPSLFQVTTIMGLYAKIVESPSYFQRVRCEPPLDSDGGDPRFPRRTEPTPIVPRCAEPAK